MIFRQILDIITLPFWIYFTFPEIKKRTSNTEKIDIIIDV